MIELLVVVSIIAILVGLLVPAVGKVRERGRRVKAAGEIRELEKAWRMYYRTYDDLPPDGSMGPGECRILSGDNPDSVVFMEMSDYQLASGMEDPWGNLYQVYFERDLQMSTAWYYSTRVYPANAARQ
jgi:type II secretory pathway pseudopilin PulG